MQKIKIIHIITGLGIGGAERSLYNVVCNLNNELFEQIIISLTDLGYWGQRLRAQGYVVISLGMRRGILDIYKLCTLCRLLNKEHPDCVQTWLHHANVLGLICARLVGIKRVIWNIRCGMLELDQYRFTTKLAFKIGGWLSRWATAIVNNSHASIQEHQAYGYNNKAWIYIPNGFDLEVFKPDSSRYREFRQQFALPHDAIIIGIIARFDPAKDHKTFLRAAALFAPKAHNVYFVCAGRDMNPQNPAMAEFINDTKLTNRLLLLDEVTDVYNLYPALDYITQTSLVEGFPNVLGEAMCCEVECIATAVGETPTLIGDNNFIIPTANPTALAVTWDTVISRPAAIIQRNRQLNRQRMSEHFSLQNTIKKYEDLYLNR